MQKAVILGAGGLGREVWFIFYEANRCKPQWDLLGFIDEDPATHGRMLCGLPVLGDFNWFANKNRGEVKVVCGIGNNESRKKVVEKANKLNLEFCSIIDPTVKMSPYVTYGVGVVIASGSIVTVQVQIGNHVFINKACSVTHDAVVHDFVNIAQGSRVSGNVTLEEGVHIGAGSVILPRITIGKWSTIGAGATVINDIPPYSVAVGTPAKVIKTREHT